MGVRGLRIGTGPRGAYVRAGRGGFYYQQYLHGSSRRPSRPSPSQPSNEAYSQEPSQPPSEDQTVLGKPVEFVGELDQTGDAFIAEVNRRRGAIRWSRIALVITVLLWLTALTTGAAGFWYIPLVGALTGAMIVRHRENVDREIRISYELDGPSADRYAVFCKAFQTVASSSMIWRFAAELDVSEGRRHAGASKLVTRTPTRISFGGAPDITTNLEPPMIMLAKARLYLLPDKLLICSGQNVASTSYRELQLSVERDHFRETDKVPADATHVGTTWQFVNNNGTPDRRFKNNRQIPILAYSELTVQHSSFGFTLQFSKDQLAATAAAALKLLSE